MLYKIKCFFWDIWTRFAIAFKLLLRDKVTTAVFLGAVLVIFYLCHSLNLSAQDQAKLPIGFINLDQTKEELTKTSEQLVQRLKQSESFEIVQGSEADLNHALEKGEIIAIFKIMPGYEKNIQRGNFNDLIHMTYPAKSEFASLLTDIFAGEMMKEICYYKSYLKYQTLDFNHVTQLTKQQYLEKIEQLEQDDDFMFDFDVTFQNSDVQSSPVQNIKNTVLYRQFVSGIFAVMAPFMLLFSFSYVCIEKKQCIAGRQKVSFVHPVAKQIGLLLSAYLPQFLISIIFTLCVCFYANCFSVFGKILMLSMAFCFVMEIIIYLLSNICSSVVSFQLAGTIIILVTGMIGFCTVFQSLMPETWTNLFHYIPNSWFIDRFADIIITN